MRWLLGLVLALAALFFLATDPGPALKRPVRLGMADLDRGKAIVDALGLHRPREGEARQVALAEADLDRGVNALAARLARGSASARIGSGRLRVEASLPLAALGRWLNLRLDLVPAGALLAPAGLRIGRLSLPDFLADDVLAWVLGRSPFSAELAAARELLGSARLSGQTLVLGFTWRKAAMARVLAGKAGGWVDGAAREAYRARLNAVAGREFAVLVGEAFALAKDRSRAGDPVAENRAALAALAEAVMGGRLPGEGGGAPVIRTSGVWLGGRGDLAQHFALSAWLAATGGEGLSDLAGLYKELKDAQGGSGFSFTDLAADRAGSRFGEACTRSPAWAGAFQSRLAGIGKSDRFFPAIGDLPEFMAQAEFQRRFGGVGQPAYQRMEAEIERRIAGLAIYREPSRE